MLIRLAALGALGYAGYKYLEKNGGLNRLNDTLSRVSGGRISGARTAAERDLDDPHVAMAGGPLSENATLVAAGEPLPV